MPATAPTALHTAACSGIDSDASRRRGHFRIIGADRRTDADQGRRERKPGVEQRGEAPSRDSVLNQTVRQVHPSRAVRLQDRDLSRLRRR